MVIKDLFGQGTDQGFAAEGTVMELLGAAEDFVEVKGAFLLSQYINHNIYIRLSLGGASRATAGAAAGQVQRPELGASG